VLPPHGAWVPEATLTPSRITPRTAPGRKSGVIRHNPCLNLGTP